MDSPEALFEALKRYVDFGPTDVAALGAAHARLSEGFDDVAGAFYARIQSDEEARAVLARGERSLGHLRATLSEWLSGLFLGPFDASYVERRARIGRTHVRVGLPQQLMFGAMNVVRLELDALLERKLPLAEVGPARRALAKLLDLELALMLHTYREDLLAARTRAERLSTFGQLVGSIGHELRNPLGVIETSLYSLRGRIGQDQRAQVHMQRIAEQLHVANDIITHLLDMIRERPLVKQRVAWLTILEAALAGLERPETLSVRVDGVEWLPDVEGDPSQLRQVLVNLLENAFHAAGPTGLVVIRGATEPPWVRLFVEDNGPGVEASVRSRLFEPMVSARPGGIGLGLALVRRIVERHGGRVELVDSTQAGSSFSVQLPLPGAV